MGTANNSGKVTQVGEIPTQGPSDFVGFLAWIWLKKVPIIVVTGLFVVFAIVNSLLAPVVFTAHLTMLPQNSSPQSDILGQVQSFTGLSFDTEVSFEQLYGEILLSDRVLDKVVGQSWNHKDYPGDISIFEVFGIEGRAEDGIIIPQALSDLKSLLRTSVLSFYRDDWSGFMTLSVTVPGDPALAADLANFLARELDAFNREIRSQRAMAQAEFIRTRLAEVADELGQASSSLTEFISGNRSYSSSPVLLQIYSELKREVDAQTSIWIELRRQLELAKIEMNKELVSISILDIASVPTKKSGPNRTFRVVVGFFVGLTFSFFMLLGIALFKQVRMKLSRSSGGI